MGNIKTIAVPYTSTTNFYRARANVSYIEPDVVAKKSYPLLTGSSSTILYIDNVVINTPQKVNGVEIGHSLISYHDPEMWLADEEYILEKAQTMMELTEFFNI